MPEKPDYSATTNQRKHCHSNFAAEYRAGAKQPLILSGRVLHIVGFDMEGIKSTKMENAIVRTSR
jgi:hypothetical protein